LRKREHVVGVPRPDAALRSWKHSKQEQKEIVIGTNTKSSLRGEGTINELELQFLLMQMWFRFTPRGKLDVP